MEDLKDLVIEKICGSIESQARILLDRSKEANQKMSARSIYPQMQASLRLE